MECLNLNIFWISFLYSMWDEYRYNIKTTSFQMRIMMSKFDINFDCRPVGNRLLTRNGGNRQLSDIFSYVPPNKSCAFMVTHSRYNLSIPSIAYYITMPSSNICNSCCSWIYKKEKDGKFFIRTVFMNSWSTLVYTGRK